MGTLLKPSISVPPPAPKPTLSSPIPAPASPQKPIISSVSVLPKPTIPPAPIAAPAPIPRLKPQPSSVASYPYTCSDCTRSFNAGVKLDPSRSLYCQECLEKIRAKRKENPIEKKPETNHPRLVTSPVAQSGLSQNTNDSTKKKRKRNKKNKERIIEPPQEKLGTLKTGQTIHFD